MLFAELNNSERCISNASEVFGVAKATASTLSAALEKKGYIQKGPFGTVKLTELGLAYVGPKLEQLRRIEQWLETGLGLPPNVAESEARRMVVTLTPETISRIILRWNNERDAVSADLTDSFFSTLPPGTYSVPFQLCKKGTRDLSMGDRGFQKPAQLTRKGEQCSILIYPQEIQCSLSQGLRPNKGTIKRLWYCQANAWYELQRRPDGAYWVPPAAVRREKDLDKWIGRVPIRVRTTVSLLKMPESDADLVFQLEAMEACGDMSGKSDNETNGAI